MPAVFVATSSAALGSPAASVSGTINVGTAEGRAVLVFTHFAAQAPGLVSVTVAGVALTRLAATDQTGNSNVIAFGGMVDATGVVSIVASWSPSIRGGFTAISATGVNPDAPFALPTGAVSFGVAHSVSIADGKAAGDLAAGGIEAGGSITGTTPNFAAPISLGLGFNGAIGYTGNLANESLISTLDDGAGNAITYGVVVVVFKALPIGAAGTWTLNDSAPTPVGVTFVAPPSAWSPVYWGGLTSMLFAAGSAGVIGALAVTEAGDTVAALATLSLSAASAKTDAGDSLVSAGSVSLSAVAASTEAADVSTGRATLSLSAAASVLEADDTSLSSSSALDHATASQTEASDTLAAAATLSLAAAFAVTDAGDSLLSAGTAASGAVSAAFAQTEAADALASTATVLVSAALSKTEDNDALASTATLGIAAALAQTEASDAVVSAATVAIAAVFAKTEASDSSASSGGLSDSALSQGTEQGDALGAQAQVSVSAALAVTEASDSLLAAGLSNDSDHAISALAEEDDHLAAAATLSLAASALLQEGDDTSAQAIVIAPPAPSTAAGGGWTSYRTRSGRPTTSITFHPPPLPVQRIPPVDPVERLPSVVARLAVIEDDDTCTARASVQPSARQRLDEQLQEFLILLAA